ncbi:MAG: ABC transporter ATP-binding protein, partial [Clostridiales bacterium]|nr:ABC transporter ATP-binding protein [Clostridiales bacterium]
MLELRGIVKDYTAGDTVVHALKGVDLAFRRSEFVSILGPSGCGKTTLLNIVGGLDHYTSGDLVIDGVSTKSYTGRDWDTYRNHRIGFVFQSYNLIPHQSILENVELALTISGVGKQERVRRAKEALDKVGLAGQYNKKPNQLSGGQCQRVAIARALVNDPEILLADEPTGALDTVTSTQIMDLIREVAKECLVIMVTHNPELAEQYSTRIIRFLDGEVVSDSNPYTAEEQAADEAAAKAAAADEVTAQIGEERTAETENAPAASADGDAQSQKQPKAKKAKLSFWTAFRLSARNLRSKFKRSFLVCLAGSIGIIGVALVLAVSAGVQGYIRDMQED